MSTRKNKNAQTKNKSIINPQHYQHTLKRSSTLQLPPGMEELPIQVVDIAEAFCIEDPHLFTAVVYLLRAGRKETADYKDDVGKAIWWLKRSLEVRGGHPEIG